MNFIYGITSSLLCTAISTFGLNLQAQANKDEASCRRNSSIRSLPASPSLVSSLHRKEKRLGLVRVRWYVGFVLYVAFQAIGSVVGLSFIPATVLAPLGAAGLVFNIFFARLMVGTQIHRTDVLGTSLIVFGCVLIALFATAAPDTHHDTAQLVVLFSRPLFIIFFTTQAIATFALLAYTFRIRKQPVKLLVSEIELSAEVDCTLLARSSSNQTVHTSLLGLKSRRLSLVGVSVDQTGTLKDDTPLIDYQDSQIIDLEYNETEHDLLLSRSFPADPLVEIEMVVNRESHILGSLFAIVGGIFSSHGMILAKSGVGLVITSFSTGQNQFASFLPIFIVFYLALAIFLQLYALNQSLIYSIPTVVFPLSYSVAACLSLLNSVVYLDQIQGVYSGVQWGYLIVGLNVLLCGVYVLRGRQA